MADKNLLLPPPHQQQHGTTRVTNLAKFCDEYSLKNSTYLYVSPSLDSSTKRYRCMRCTLAVPDGCYPLGCPIAKRRSTEAEEGDEEFVTVGVFCSFNCCKAFAAAKTSDPEFRFSNELIAEMYACMRDKSPQQSSTKDRQGDGGENRYPPYITPSPPIELLACYGGEMSESQYVASFNRLIYTDKGYLKLYPLPKLIEETETLY